MCLSFVDAMQAAFSKDAAVPNVEDRLMRAAAVVMLLRRAASPSGVCALCAVTLPFNRLNGYNPEWYRLLRHHRAMPFTGLLFHSVSLANWTSQVLRPPRLSTWRRRQSTSCCCHCSTHRRRRCRPPAAQSWRPASRGCCWRCACGRLRRG